MMPMVSQLPQTASQTRNWRQAIGRGVLSRCPACGEGHLFTSFLKPVAACESCGEDLSHQRADDLPPYIVITIVGHVVLGGLLLAEQHANWSMATHMMVWPAMVLVLSLLLMQPAKGGVIGLQWAMRMHGFEDASAESAKLAPIMRQENLPNTL